MKQEKREKITDAKLTTFLKKIQFHSTLTHIHTTSCDMPSKEDSPDPSTTGHSWLYSHTYSVILTSFDSLIFTPIRKLLNFQSQLYHLLNSPTFIL